MSLNNFFTDSPTGWIFISSFFSAAALAGATVRIKKEQNPEQAANRKWVMVCILFSLAVIAAICGLYIPGTGKMNDIKLLYFYLAATILMFPGFRFKKAAGIPLFIILGIAAPLLFFFFQPFTPANGKTTAGTLYVLAASGKSNTIEIMLPRNSSLIMEIEGDYFYPEIDVITVHDALTLSGVKHWYCFRKITGYTKPDTADGFIKRQSTDITNTQEIPDALFGFYRTRRQFFPLLTMNEQKLMPVKAEELKQYEIFINENGSITVELKE